MITWSFEHEIRRRPTDRREVIIRIERISFHADLSLSFYTHTDRTDLTDLCSRQGAHWGLEHEIFLNTNNANDTNNYLHADLALYFKRTLIAPIARMLVRVGMLTWSLLNEIDKNEINTDSTRSFVNTNCLCSVLKV